MAIYRQIQMTFWSDSKVIDDFSIEDKFFYLYLLTNPHTNLAGCYELSLRKASEETGYKKDVAEKILARLEQEHKVVRYSKETKEVLIINWWKYNWTASEKFRKPLYQCINAIKNKYFKQYLLCLYNNEESEIRYRIDTMCIDTNCTDTTVTDTDTVSVSKEVKHKYGEYNNVLLTDGEMEKLKAEFPKDWGDRVESLSLYIKSKGDKYKDHLATIRNWSRRENKEKRAANAPPNKFRNYEQREMDYDSLIARGDYS